VPGIGGIFVRCAKPADRLREETAAADSMPGIPILVAADIEFAAQGRLLEGTDHPCQMAVGAAADPEVARRMGAIAGSEGRAAGIRWTFSPVADLAYNHRVPA
jgi:beta-N-acetylhexosaminidase